MLKFSTSLSGGTVSPQWLHPCYFILDFFRYKYLQKPPEESALPGLLQYINRWSPAQKDKLCVTIGLLISQGLANASCLQSLTKDHLVKNGMNEPESLLVTLILSYPRLKTHPSA